MAEIRHHENLMDWCHICGSRFYPSADVHYPKQAETDRENTEYLRICAHCADRVLRVTNPDHNPERAQTTFDKRLADAEQLITCAMTGFEKHLHAKESEQLLRAMQMIRKVRSRYE